MQALIIIPTYNERENIEQLLPNILAEVPTIDILIIDDNSPDGTGTVLDQMSSTHAHIKVLHRSGKLGLGTAYIAGFRYALEHNYDLIFEMDADFSHDPKYLPQFIEASRNADMVIGSRYIPGGATPNWSFLRRCISGGGNIFTRLVLGIPVHDCTSGYRCYHRHTLETIAFEEIQSLGYSFQVELVYQALKHHLRVAEIPIVFFDRRVGQSKMSRGIFVEAFRYVITTLMQTGRAPKQMHVHNSPPQTNDESSQQSDHDLQGTVRNPVNQ